MSNKSSGFQSCGRYYEIGINKSYIEYLKKLINEIKNKL